MLLEISKEILLEISREGTGLRITLASRNKDRNVFLRSESYVNYGKQFKNKPIKVKSVNRWNFILSLDDVGYKISIELKNGNLVGQMVRSEAICSAMDEILRLKTQTWRFSLTS